MTFAPEASLVERVNARAQAWQQGDVIEVGAVAWLAAASEPLTSQGAASGDEGVRCVIAESERLVVVSQTCDIIRDCCHRPFVVLARVVNLEEPDAGDARRGSRPRFVHLPGLGDKAFADLDLLVTVEKAVIFDAEPTRGLPDESSQRRFGTGVGRVFSRFAFPNDLVVALRGLVARVRSKHAKDSPEGRALVALEDIRVTASPGWDAAEMEVFVTFAPATREAAEAVMSEEDWDQVVDGWLRRAEPFGVVTAVDGAMIPLDELTAREYIDSDALDLDYLSWSPSVS
jgi:hypothetical protein